MSNWPSPQVSEAFRRGAGVENLRGLRVTVMGLGRFGGGVGVVQYLQSQQARVTVTDLATAGALATSLSRIDVAGLAALRLELHHEQDFTDTDLVVVNPAVRRTHPLLLLAADAGVPLTSEINLFWQRNPTRTVAVTGSVGKSTTVTLIHAMLSGAGVRCHLGGNLGGSLLGELERMESRDWTVLELSSFQLWDLNHLKFAPDIAVVTNLFPHHLDWHGSFDAYSEAKYTVTRWQSADQLCVLPEGHPVCSTWKTAARRVTFANTLPNLGTAVACRPGKLHCRHDGVEQSVSVEDWPEHLRSDDQCLNVAASVAVAVEGIGLDLAICASALKAHRPLPHRREFVALKAGRRFINDSKATTPPAAVASIREAIGPERRVLLIAGGAGKGSPLSEFASEIARHVAVVALVGDVAPALEEELQRTPSPCLVEKFRSLKEAFQWVVAQSQPGDVVLLSPGFASYGEFLNYEARGEAFRQLVTEWQDVSSCVPAGREKT